MITETPMEAMEAGRETFYEDYITCPYCGHEDYDTCDYPDSLQREDDTATMDCAECGREFRVVLRVEYTYKSRPLTPEASHD